MALMKQFTLAIVPAPKFTNSVCRLAELFAHDTYVDISSVMAFFVEGAMNGRDDLDTNQLRRYISSPDHLSIEYAIDLILENHHHLHFQMMDEFRRNAPWLMLNNYKLETLYRLQGSGSLALRVFEDDNFNPATAFTAGLRTILQRLH